jgi:hypothetical protein
VHSLKRPIPSCLGLDWLFERCSSTSKKRAKILEKGTDRIGSQLDIVKFLKKQMVLDILLKIQLSPLERYLARR